MSAEIDPVKRSGKQNPMSKKAVFCIVAYITRANHIVDRLKSAKFSNTEISVLFPASAVPPTGMAGALGWLASIGASTIPEIGRIIATGPIVAALHSIKAGAEVGGITVGLIGSGLAETEASGYEERVKEGNILLSVHAETSVEITQAKKIFEESGAQDICITGETSSMDNLTERMLYPLEIASAVSHSQLPKHVVRLSSVQDH